MLPFLAGFGITLVILFVIFGFVVAFAGIIATIRAAINGQLGTFSKIVWILCNLFIPGVAFLYFAFVDRNGFLKFVGWFCILVMVVAAVTGGTALWGGIEGIRQNPDLLFEAFPPVENPQNPPVPEETPDDSSVAL